jgi:hypothetical protein
MKLYDFTPAANAQRVRVFLAEKGLQVPTEQLNVRDGAQFVEPFNSMNPFHCVPFLAWIIHEPRMIADTLSGTFIVFMNNAGLVVSASSAISCSNAFYPYRSKPMKPKLEQEVAEVAERSF